MSYVACILAFGLYYVVRKYLPSRLRRVKGVDFVPFVLLAIGTTTLADTSLGALIANWLIQPLLAAASALIASITGAGISAALLATVAGVLLVVAAVFDLIDLRPDGIAKTAVIVLPFLMLVAIGPIADASSGLFAAVSESGTTALTRLVGQ